MRRSIGWTVWITGALAVAAGAPGLGRAADVDPKQTLELQLDANRREAQRQRDQAEARRRSAEFEASMRRPVDPRGQEAAAQAFARTGFDVGLAWPAAISGWSAGPGAELGFGFGASPVRTEIALLQGSRRVGNQRLGLLKIPMFLGYRGQIGTPYLRWLLGGELGYERQDVVSTLGKGDLAAAFWGAGVGLNAGLPLGSLYLSAGWMFHYDFRFSASSTVASDAEVSAFGSHHPTYHVFTAAVGYQYR